MGAGEIRAGKALVEIGTDNNALSQGLNKAEKQLKAFGTVVTAVGKDFLKLGLGIVTPIIGAGVAFAKMGADMANASARTGVAVEALSQLSYAAQQSGVDMETLESGIRKMQKVLGSAAEGGKDAQESLQRLGLTFGELAKLSPDEQLKVIADRMNQFASPTDRAKIAMEIFGKGGAALIPLLEQGGEGITAWQERAKALGLTMSGEGAAAAKSYWRSLEDLRDVIANGLFRAGEAVAPVLQKIANFMVNGIVAANKWITGHKEMVILALKIGAGITVAGGALIAMGATFAVIGSVAGGLATAISLVVGSVALLASVLTNSAVIAVGATIAALVGLASYMGYASDTGRVVLSQLGQYFNDLKKVALSAFGGITDALMSGDFKLAAEVAWSGVKVAFAEGVKPIMDAWINLKEFARETWNSVTTTMVKSFYIASSYFVSVWEKARSIFNSIMDDISTIGARTIIAAQETVGLISKPEADAQRKQLAGDSAATHADSDRDLKNRIRDIELERDAKLKTLNDIDGEKSDAIKRSTDAEIEADTKVFNEKKKQLQELLAKAKDEREKNPNGLFGEIPEVPNIPKNKDFKRSLEQMEGKSVSTFGANALGQIAGRSANPQEAAQNKTAEHQKRMENLMRMVVDKVGGAYG